jgi:hypothetical protein
MTNSPEHSARANIPASALRDMTSVGYDARADLGAYRFSHSPCGAIPTDHSAQQVSRTSAPGDGTGWQHEIPISNPPGTAQCDKLMDAADARDRAAAAAQTEQSGG